MKNFSFSVFNIVSVFAIFLLIVLIWLPFNLINIKQAERIATWKAEYEELKYSFDLVKAHEGNIVPTSEEIGKIITDDLVWNRIAPYLNLQDSEFKTISGYKYRLMNGIWLKKKKKYYFNKFVTTKDGMFIGFKRNPLSIDTDNPQLYFFFIDINGKEKPNRYGQDIFFLNIYKDHITTAGYGKPKTVLKTDCSPIGKGFYCSEYYLLGGNF